MTTVRLQPVVRSGAAEHCCSNVLPSWSSRSAHVLLRHVVTVSCIAWCHACGRYVILSYSADASLRRCQVHLGSAPGLGSCSIRDKINSGGVQAKLRVPPRIAHAWLRVTNLLLHLRHVTGACIRQACAMRIFFLWIWSSSAAQTKPTRGHCSVCQRPPGCAREECTCSRLAHILAVRF